MTWDHPNNFKFVLTWLEAQRQRTDNFYQYYTPLGQIFEYRFNDWWQQVWPQAYALNAVLETWNRFSPEGFQDNWPPTFHTGPVWREGPSYLPKALALPDFGLLNPFDIRKDVEKKARWEEWPTFEEIWSAIHSQAHTDQPTAFQPYWSGYSSVGYYREDFILYLMKRSKLLWETDLQFPHVGKCFLGAGRVTLDPTFDAPSNSYKTVIYFVVNEGTHHCKLFEVKPGCCKRFKKR